MVFSWFGSFGITSMRDPLHDIGPINVLIPLAGKGERFKDAGYTIPKPLIPVDGEPMITASIKSLGLPANSSLIKYIYITLQEHEKLGVTDYLSSVSPGCTIIQLNTPTEGALCSALIAEKHINDNKPLLIANTDQLVNCDILEILKVLKITEACGMLITFESKVGDKYSFCKVYDEKDDLSAVIEVAEKVKISNIANTGVYLFNKGSDFVWYGKKSIENNNRYNGEFYIAPMYNELIKAGEMVLSYKCDGYTCLGDPESLRKYESRCR